MSKQKIIIASSLTAAVLVASMAMWFIFLSTETRAQNSSDEGFSFTLAVQTPGQDDVVYEGAVLGQDMRLVGSIGGIEVINLLSDGKLYVLTPAIKTCREVDNPPQPSRDESGWAEWLLEPGRVNPLTFASTIGEENDVSGDVEFGSDDGVQATFEEGRLIRLSFPAPSGDEMIVYEYAGYRGDEGISASDFAVPEDYD